MNQHFTMEQFRSWLLARHSILVGEASRCFTSPLANFLSELSHVAVGVEDGRYGRASLPWQGWNTLPRWATSFMAYTERRSFQPLTGQDALRILADVEYSLPR